MHATSQVDNLCQRIIELVQARIKEVIARMADITFEAASPYQFIFDGGSIVGNHPAKSQGHRVFATELAAEVWGCFTVHYTPSHGSWLNPAEIEIGIFSRQGLGTRRIPSLRTLRREAKAWNRRMNRNRVKISWSLTAKLRAASSGYKRNPFKPSQT